MAPLSTKAVAYERLEVAARLLRVTGGEVKVRYRRGGEVKKLRDTEGVHGAWGSEDTGGEAHARLLRDTGGEAQPKELCDTGGVHCGGQIPEGIRRRGDAILRGAPGAAAGRMPEGRRLD